MDRLSVDVTQIAQGLEERVKTRGSDLKSTGFKRKEAEPRGCLGLLSFARNRQEKQTNCCESRATHRPWQKPGTRCGCVAQACPDSAPSGEGHQNLPTDNR